MPIYRDLIAWQKAMDLADDVDAVVDRFPPFERFALAQQTRKAASSVPSNIAEGRGRGTHKDFCHFLKIARGSMYELETHLIRARRRKYINELEEADLLQKSERVIRLINGLIRKFEPRPPTSDRRSP